MNFMLVFTVTLPPQNARFGVRKLFSFVCLHSAFYHGAASMVRQIKLFEQQPPVQIIWPMECG